MGMSVDKWWLRLLTVMYVSACSLAARSVYYMDRNSDCSFIGLQDVARDQSVTIIGRSPGSTSDSQSGCSLKFRAIDTESKLELRFTTYIIKACGVSLYLSGDAAGAPTKYSCSEKDNPRDYFSIGRTMSITLHKTDITNINYNFSATVTSKRESSFPPPGDSNPMAVGMVIGIVGSVFFIIILISCTGVCCFRKYRVRGSSKSPYLYDPDSKVKLDETHSTGGYFNESARVSGSPMSKKKLLAPSDSSDEKANSWQNGRQKGRRGNLGNDNKSSIPPPPPLPNNDSINRMGNSGQGGEDDNVFSVDRNKKNLSNERSVDVDTRSKNPMLSALHGNKKFRDTFRSTEADADERAKRISSSSSLENFGQAPKPPSSNESLTRPALPSVPKSPKGKKQKHAAIHRNPRPTSLSSDELGEIERGRRRDDRNIQIIPTDSSSPSSATVAVKVNDKNNKKNNTTHSLRPDRKAPRGKTKNKTQSVSSAVDPEPLPSPRDPKKNKNRLREVERDLNDSFDSRNSSGRYSKRARRSPRPGRMGGKGFSHRRGRSMDQLDSRPTTPTSAFGSMEDLESLPPLQRASSKNSLYASRSSLYDRRGRRRGSNSESVYSYRDDMSVHRRSGYVSYSDDETDGYEKPLSRRDRDRMYRSENDLGRTRKEISTQTLRETATQTGPNESVIMQPKMLVKKKRRSRSVSTSGTQTEKKGNVKKGKSKAEEKIGNRQETTEKRKSKRSKSLNALDAEAEESPKPKPKPRPRKSTSAGKLLDSEHKSASAENLADTKNPYYPQSEGFMPTGYNPQSGYPMMVPGYPGTQGQYPGQPVYPGQYPYPMQGAPPGYNPNMYQPQQPAMNGAVPQGQPVARKPRKSNWELLCEMTDGEHQYDDLTETGSVASSVFTSNPHSVPGYGVQAGPQPPYLTNSYPSKQYGQPAMTTGNQGNGPAQGKDNKAQNQSSWEALKSMTETSVRPTTNAEKGMKRNESVV